jgi:3-hydroxyisobutyrate dehydrogenase-like beta-hydroxyacid dehydrogenase
VSVVALLHPGMMGSRIGGELVAAGHEVRWLSAGRSPATRDRAVAEHLTETSDLAGLLHEAAYVVAVCPPQGALDVAHQVAATGWTGTYVDANPVSASTLAQVASTLPDGVTLVDAGIVGPPPRDGHRTHLYLAGPRRTAEVAALFAGSRVTPKVVGERLGAASAAKQAYAMFNKGRLVLAAQAAALADAHGVADVLAAESDRPGADVLAEVAEVRAGLRDVGWRWGPEFAEVAATLADAGLDPVLAVALQRLLAAQGVDRQHRRPAGGSRRTHRGLGRADRDG